jgi:hypothetical protein
LGHRDDPGGDRERRIIALDRPVDQRLRHRLLAGGKRPRVGCPVADEVGPGIVGDLTHDRFALRRISVDRGTGEAGLG